MIFEMAFKWVFVCAVVLMVAVVQAQPAGLQKPVDVVFKAKLDGSEQRYVQMLPADFNAREKHDLLIALHGHGSDRWQYVTQERDECRAARDMAAKYSMIYISPDYRAMTSWMGPKAEADMVQMIKDLRKKHRVDRVFLIGGSMGATSALSFAVLHPELISGVCSQNPLANHLEYTNFQDAIAESFGGTKQQIPAEYKKRSAEYWPERLTFPVAITTGGLDDAVPPASAMRLAGVLKTIGRDVLLIHREQTGHSTNYEDTVAAFEFVISHAKR
ncbi:MAG: alpha/beta hydrolase family protein [Armatimonadota bacterium]